VTAEEKGLLGSEYYADNPLRPLATTAGVINMDGPFAAEKTVNFSISGAAKLDTRKNSGGFGALMIH
jgi:Zn-dependent M28 family amino/carboxypeptidase